MNIKQFLQSDSNSIDISEYEDLYRLILEYLQNENDFNKLKHYLIRRGDIDSESLMAELEIAIDKDYDQLYDTIKDNYWNPSIQIALSHLDTYQSKIQNPDAQITPDITLDDIKNANAGYSFEERSSFVLPK